MFEKLEKTVPERLIIAVAAMPKHGKTHFALTAPDPIYMLDLDVGASGPFRNLTDKTVYRSVITFPGDYDDDAGYRNTWSQFALDWLTALEEANKNGGTVVVDTATRAWDLVQHVHLGIVVKKRLKKLRETMPTAEEEDLKKSRLDYGLPNAVMDNILRLGQTYPRANLVFTHSMREIYNEKGAATGTFLPKWFSGMPSIAEVVLQLRMDGNQPPVKGEIVANRFSNDLHGTVLKNPTFQDIWDLVI